MKRMWGFTVFLILILGLAFCGNSQTAVGYINLSISPGDNLIAAQLDDGLGNTLNDALTTGVATGSTFTEQDPTTLQLLPLSIWNGTTWSINYDFGPNGIGGMLHSPTAATVTIIGSVVNYNINTGTYTFVPPTRGPGSYLLAMAAPLAGTFQQVVGRAPENGDAVETLNGSTQTYQTTSFVNGAWNNGTPSLAVGQAAYFELQIPEPSALVLSGVGAAMLIGLHRSKFGTFKKS